MTETEKMVREINGFFRAMGEDQLAIPKPGEWKTELQLLRKIKGEYRKQLLEKIPRYRLIASEDAIPDMFLQALRKRESKLEGKET